MELSSTDSGKRKRKRSTVRRSLEYPCVSRLRHRRLLIFLWRNKFDSTFQALAEETDVFFHVGHLKELVRQGRWNDAIQYVFRFVPSVDQINLDEEFSVFFRFLHVQRDLAHVAARNWRGDLVARMYEHNLKPTSSTGFVRLARMVLGLYRSEQLRASVNWHLVRLKAAEIVGDLILQAPEFKDLVRLPTSRDRPHNILPIGSSSRRRRHVKKEGRIPASDLAKFYIEKKSRNSSIMLFLIFDIQTHTYVMCFALSRLSHFEGSSSTEPGLSLNTTALLAAKIGQSLRAGMRPMLGYPSEDSGNEGMKRQVIIEDVGRQGFFARNNPKRSLTTVCHELNPKRQQLSGEFGQTAGSIFQAHHSQGDVGVRDVESNMKCLSASSGDVTRPLKS